MKHGSEMCLHRYMASSAQDKDARTVDTYRRWKENLDQEALKNVSNGYIHGYVHGYIHGHVHGYIHLKHILRLPGLGFLSIYGMHRIPGHASQKIYADFLYVNSTPKPKFGMVWTLRTREAHRPLDELT